MKFLCYFAVGFLVVILGIAFFAEYSGSYNSIALHKGNLAPTPQYILGTDFLGRNLFYRVCVATKTSLLLGLFAVIVNICIGIPYGAFLAFYKRSYLHSLLDMVATIPLVLRALLIVSLLGKGLWTLFCIALLNSWTKTALVTKNATLAMKKEPFIEAVKHFGIAKKNLFLGHILPHIMATVLTTSGYSAVHIICLEVLLTILQVGIQAPEPSWGELLHKALFDCVVNPYKWLVVMVFITFLFALHILVHNVKNS